MKKVFLCIILVAVSSAGFSQTKKIAHRSHSGKNNTFSITGPDNFGETPEMARKRKAEKAKADSLAKKIVADSLARITKLQPAPKTKIKNKSTVRKDSTHH